MLCQLLLYRFDDDTKKSLNFFLLYLSHCKIEFSAYGLVKIDRSLLPMVCVCLSLNSCLFWFFRLLGP